MRGLRLWGRVQTDPARRGQDGRDPAAWIRPLAAGAALAGAIWVTGFPGYAMEPVGAAEAADASGAEDGPRSPYLDSLERVVARHEAKLRSAAPRNTYVAIDRANNRLWVRRGSEVSLEAVVSTGSGTILRESGGEGRTWTFDTPAGRFQILAERRNPVWVKPDWAFLEEGLQPPATLADRREPGSLGEWALDLGDGYMIHGTLYERLLGRSLTHGCIRVGRDDLRAVAAAVRPGTPVYIF